MKKLYQIKTFYLCVFCFLSFTGKISGKTIVKNVTGEAKIGFALRSIYQLDLLIEQIKTESGMMMSYSYEETVGGGVIAGNLTCSAGAIEITGVVFEDYDYDGQYDSGEHLGVEGIMITATDSLGNSSNTTSASDGTYTLGSLTAGRTYRIEFTNMPSWANPTFYGGDNGTLVQFVKSGNCVNLGVASPADYCQSNPRMAIPCYVNGDSNNGLEAMVSFDYTASGNASNGNKLVVAPDSLVGAVWGVAFNRDSQIIYTAAIQKRHVGFTSHGPGAIFKIDNSDPTNPVVSHWMTIANAGTDPHVGLPTGGANLTPSKDSASYDQVGKMSLGDIDISEDGKTLWVMNLFSKSLLKINIATKTQTNVYSLPTSFCNHVDETRPWAIEVYKGEVYVGLVCSGEDDGTISASVVQLQSDGTFLEVTPVDLSYTKQETWTFSNGSCTYPSPSAWKAWTATWPATICANPFGSNDNYLHYEQPILSDIEFDTDGSIILGFLDRFGMQSGPRNYKPDQPNGNTDTYYPFSGGDILRICKIGGSYVQETSSGGCSYKNGFEYYIGDVFINSSNAEQHKEMSLGAMAHLPGSGEVAIAAFDALNLSPYAEGVNAGGVRWLSNTTGDYQRGYLVYENTITAAPGTFAKAAGLGDMELLCDPAPIEIGNYIWEDTDGDGIQDGGEPGLVCVRVELYDASGTLLAIDTTNSLGYYFFSGNGIDNATWQTANDTLAANTNYYIVAGGNGQFASGEMILSGTTYILTSDSLGNSTNRYEIDSDGEIAVNVDSDFDGEPYLQITTGNIGQVNHSFDFGFVPKCEFSITSAVAQNCTGSGPFTAEWQVIVSYSGEPTGNLSYQKNSETATIFIPNTSPDTLTISTDADGGLYDTLKVWFTNDLTCGDTMILKRPTPCPTTITPLVDCSIYAAPGTITEQTCDGNRAWNNTANIQADDATFATTTGNLTFSLPNSNCLEFTDFGFSIPATATITGINISIRKKGETNNSTVDKSIQLLVGGTATGNDKASTDLWSAAAYMATYGGKNDLWGATLTPADVNASNFGFTFQAARQASTGEARIEYVEMSICYTDVATTEVGGAVYEDWNFNGVQEDNETSGVQGVQVLAYDCDNNLAATTYTDIYGNYKFAGLSGGADYRIEFILPEVVACWAKPTQSGTNNGTTIQFVQAGTLANLGLINLTDYCQENPQLVTACFTRGDIATNGSELAILSSFDSEARNTGTAAEAFSTTHNINVPLSNVGAVWGLAYAKNCDNIFAAATVKTQTEIASDGIGAIYVIDNSANTNVFGGTNAVTSATLWLDLEATEIGLNLGDNPYDTEPYTNGFNRTAYAAVGKHGIGDIDVAEDGSALFATNLYNRTLLEIPIGANCAAPVSGSEIKEIVLPTPASCTDVIRPWAVKVNKGKVYVGMVCSGEQSIITNDDRTGIDRSVLIAYVYEYDPISGAFGGNPVLEFPLDYDRTWTSNGQPAAWYPWFDRFVWDMYFTKQRSGTDIYTANYSQPILSDIEFDGCNMIIGLLDRVGNQFGYGPPPNDELANGTLQQGYPAGTTNMLVFPAGDLLLAGANADGTWTIENNGSITSICGDKTALNGDPQDLRNTLPEPHKSATGRGPGGNEFFWGDYYGSGHGEVTIGALAIRQSSGEVISMAWDPLQHVANEFGIGGAIWLNTNTGIYEKGLKLYENNVLTFQKGSGFGDVELICGDAPIEIGNYVWEDTDGDGIQDACEPGIENVRVELYNISGDLIAFDTTDANGQYYFSHSDSIDQHWIAVMDSIEANTTYYIVIGRGDFTSNQLTLGGNNYILTSDSLGSSQNRYAIDSDAEIVTSSPASAFDNLPATEITTGDWGCVDHSFDFGFIPIICPDNVCLDEHVKVGSGEFYQLNWNPEVTGWVTPPDDPNQYPYTQTINLAGTTITADVTLSHRANDSNLADEHYACPSGCPMNNIDGVDMTGILGSDTVFRFWKPTTDSIITVNIVFSEPILLYETGMGGPASRGGGSIMSAWDDSIGIDANQRLAVLDANVVLPNPAVHPNPGVNHFHTETDDETTEPTVNYFAHDAQGSYAWGAGQDPSVPAPAPINYMDEFVGTGAGTGGDILLGQEDGFYYNLSRDNKRSWVVMDYAGVEVRSISWQLLDEDDGDFDTALGNGTATIGDFFDYITTGNRSAYLGGFTFQKIDCPKDTLEYCLDGGGPTSVDVSADASKTSNIIWYNSDSIQVGTGATLTVSAATLGMADSTETFHYSGTDIATNCFGYSCCPIVVNSVSCCPTDAGLTNMTCSDNSTAGNLTDDYIIFDLNPSGKNLVGNYNLTVSSGTITPTTGTYGAATTFQLQNGSIGAGDVTLTITDASDPGCTLDVLITDPGECVLLKLIKTADKTSATAGDTIFYTYQVINNSIDNLTLSDLTDDKLGTISTEITGADRVTDQLQVLYRFEDGSGTTISDNSGVAPAMDLTIQNGSNYTWGIDSLDFTGINRADNTTNNSKVYSSITASGELTVEAWIKPDNNTQGGAARIISQSFDNSDRNFQLMQRESQYQFRIRTTGNGSNEQSTSTGIIPASTVLQHVVFTYDGTTPQFYLNGSPITTTGSAITGDFSTWDSDYDFSIGNEVFPATPDGQRDWQGEYHLAAVYSKALSAAEVSKNYAEGIGPVLVPTVLANGDTSTFTAFYEVTGAENSPIKNIANITGTPPSNTALMATDSASVIINHPTFIGNFVWIDTNMDGLQDATEPGVDGIKVILYDAMDVRIDSALTNTGGFYEFEITNPDDYYLRFEIPTDWTITTKDIGSNDSLDSDINLTTFVTDDFTVMRGDTNMTFDVGLHACGYNLIVTGHVDDEIHIFDDSGNLVSSTPAAGGSQPNRIVAGPDGNLYVTEYGNNRVYKMAPDGMYISDFITGLSTAEGMVFGPNGDAFIIRYGTQEVMRYDEDGVFLNVVADSGDGLTDAQHLTVDPQGRVYVAEGDTIKRFQPDGTFIDNFIVEIDPGFSGAYTGELSWGPDGNLYVVNRAWNSIDKFAPDGTPLGKVVDYDAGGLDNPIGFTFGPDGNLYVTSAGTNNVKVYNGTTGAYISDFFPSGTNGLMEPFDLIFVPKSSCCEEINELITTRSICHGENVDTLAALTTFTDPDSIAFVYFATAQTDSSVIYTGGMGIDTVQISTSSDTARITDVSGFTNTGSGTQQYFVYAIAHPTPSDNTCRPYEEIIVNVKSVATVSISDVEICEGETTTISATVGNTGSKPSIYTWTVPAGESDPGNVLSFSASTSGTYTLSVFNNGCTVEGSGDIILKSTPTASVFAIQPSCDNNVVQADGYLQISAFANGDRYNWVMGSDYIGSGGDPDYVDALAIGALPFKFNQGISNPTGSQDYTVRIFNSNGCFQDYTITMNQQDCAIGCYCEENIYLNETTTGGSVHKFKVNSDGSLSEIGMPWYDNAAAGGELISPHGLAADLNGFLYIGESNSGGEIRRFTCDGEILPESEFAITTAGQFNMGSIGNTLYVGERDFAGIVAYDLCTGAEVGRLQFCENTGNLAGNWGFFIDPVTEQMYATNSQTPWIDNRVWSFDESQFTATGLPCISNIDTIRNDANSPLRDARFMGITTDPSGNIYIVVDDDSNYTGDPSYVLKYGPAPFHPFIAISLLDSLADGTGFNDAHAIVYSETSDRIYVSTNSAFDDCVAIFDTDLNYLGAAVPSPGDGSQAKGMTILKECCPINNNVTIDTTLCVTSLNDSFYLQEIINCTGVICEGMWTPSDSNTGLTYNACGNTIKITDLNACGTFTLTSDGVGNNPQCGAFIITVNISVGDVIAPVVVGNQTVCNGGNPTAFTIATAATGSNTITYQWQSTTDTLLGFTNIPSGTNATYDPLIGIADTTYYRVIAAVSGGCSTGNCQDTSNVIIVTVVNCDYGDLPDIANGTTGITDYETYDSTGGPSHLIIAGLFLGDTVDVDTDGFPDPLAFGDDTNEADDEDGITIPSSLDISPGGIIRLPLSITNLTTDTAYLEAWIDWDGDGDFDEINEMVTDLKDNEDGVFPAYLEINVPTNALTGSSIGFRVRLSNTDNMTPYGRINSGEVEDYLLSIDCPQVCLPIQVTIQKE